MSTTKARRSIRRSLFCWRGQHEAVSSPTAVAAAARPLPTLLGQRKAYGLEAAEFFDTCQPDEQGCRPSEKGDTTEEHPAPPFCSSDCKLREAELCDKRSPIEEECPPAEQCDVADKVPLAVTACSTVRTTIRDVPDASQEDLAADVVAGDDLFFNSPPEDVPAVGGLVDLKGPHSKFLLPLEVALYEPSEEEVFRRGTREIFMNRPLTEQENMALAELHRALADEGIGGQRGDFPRYMRPHALRMLHTYGFNVGKVLDAMQACLKERVHRMPMVEADVLDDLRLGGVYWHGRDRSCRPCLVVPTARFSGFLRDKDFKERVFRLMMFTLEYAVRYAMVPGRVENWVVILDLADLFKAVSMFQVPSLAASVGSLATALEKVYCGRMGWIKIVNGPGGAVLSKAVNGFIPADKKDKVNFAQNTQAALAECFEPNQLERRYGGSAPDLKPEEVYPFHFFPNARGDVSQSGCTSVVAAEDSSLHSLVGLSFHEGVLWDDSSADARSRWVGRAAASALTPEAAEVLTGMSEGQLVRPACDMASWLAAVNPAELERRKAQQGLDPARV